MHKGWSLVLAALLASSSAVAQATAIRTLRIVVGFAVGGGYDAYARMLSRHMGRHLPGTPVVIVQNMPGAAGLKALQYLDNGAPTDGSVIAAFNPGSITEFLVNPDAYRFNFMDVAWVGSITRDLRACYAWAATGIKTFDDLKRSKQFNMGAPARGTSTYMDAAVLKNVFGVAVHQVMGYSGSAEQRIAIERGELDGDCGAWSSLPPDWLTGRKINTLISFSPVPIPGLPSGVPFVRDLAPTQEAKDALDILMTTDTLGRPYAASRQVPAARLAALRRAFDATTKDAQFLAEAEKLNLPVVGSVSGADAEKIVASLYAAPSALIARTQAMVAQ